MTIYAALFEDGEPIGFISGSLRLLNLNVTASRTWREVPREIATLSSVPPLGTLEAHPELAEPL